MAITKTVLAKDNRKAIVRVTATSAGNGTIDIDADLKLTNETITTSALKVAIQKIEYSCQAAQDITCLLYTSPSPRDLSTSRMPSSA